MSPVCSIPSISHSKLLVNMFGSFLFAFMCIRFGSVGAEKGSFWREEAPCTDFLLMTLVLHLYLIYALGGAFPFGIRVASSRIVLQLGAGG